mmetsp:Transcript_21452/g.36619  ORF Transcript_21452/g.36619 Transcript_21452/m.36619 type:complete len:156 (+) Transcript_21452:89-556(+)
MQAPLKHSSVENPCSTLTHVLIQSSSLSLAKYMPVNQSTLDRKYRCIFHKKVSDNYLIHNQGLYAHRPACKPSIPPARAIFVRPASCECHLKPAGGQSHLNLASCQNHLNLASSQSHLNLVSCQQPYQAGQLSGQSQIFTAVSLLLPSTPPEALW